MSHFDPDQLADLINQREGRVISPLRYWLSYWLIFAAFALGTFVASADIPWWGVALMIAPLFILHTILLDKYKQRSLN